MEPINYILDVKSPIEQAMIGYGLGRQDIEQTQVMQEREQLMDVRASQEARAAAEDQDRRAAAAQDRARAEAMQSQLMDLRGMAMDGTLTSEALDKFALANASTFDEFRTAFQNVSEPRRQADVQFGLQLSTSLLRGNTDAALSILDTRIAASENAGTPASLEEAQRLRVIRAEAEADPIGFATANLANLTAQGAIDSTTMKTVLEASGQGGGGEDPAKVAELKFRAEKGGLVPGTPEYNEFMVRGGEVEKGPLVQNIVGAGETEFAKTAGKEAATQFSAITNQGTVASRSLTELENLETLLANVETGGTAKLKEYLGGFGIATEGLGDIQAVSAAINRLVPQQRQPGSGEMSNADLDLFKKSVPSLINQPGGNELIVETLRAINEYDVAASIISGMALDGEITPAEARKRLRELPNPLADFKAPKAVKPGAATVVIDGAIVEKLN